MSDPLSTDAANLTHRSVAENGLDREEDDDEACLTFEGGGCGFAGECVREAVGAAAAARLIAAIAAAEAALVWFCTLAHALFTPACCFVPDA